MLFVFLQQIHRSNFQTFIDQKMIDTGKPVNVYLMLQS